jgi:hypothetical protein
MKLDSQFQRTIVLALAFAGVGADAADAVDTPLMYPTGPAEMVWNQHTTHLCGKPNTFGHPCEQPDSMPIAWHGDRDGHDFALEDAMDPTSAHLKRCRACDQQHSSRESIFSYRLTGNHVATLQAQSIDQPYLIDCLNGLHVCCGWANIEPASLSPRLLAPSVHCY